MATISTTDADEIRRHMAQIRRDLHQDVLGVVHGAEAATDWRRYLVAYPLVTIGLAAGIGYWFVPKKKSPRIQPLVQFVEKPAESLTSGTPEEKDEKKKVGLIGAAFGMIGPIVWRYAQGYAVQYAENWIAQQAAALTPSPPAQDPTPSRPNVSGRTG